MNQADLSKLVSKLRINIAPRHRNLKNIDGPEGRLRKLRKTVTALFKYERIDLYYNRADEARAYAERLISDAIRYGDCHTPTMDMANFWILEKQIIHKLFKVLVPRYQEYTIAYTRMLRAPRPYPGQYWKRAVLELRGNPFPPLTPDLSSNRNLIHNVLLEEARKEYRAQKYSQMAEGLESTSGDVAQTEDPIVTMAAADVSPDKEDVTNLDAPDVSSASNESPETPQSQTENPAPSDKSAEERSRD